MPKRLVNDPFIQTPKAPANLDAAAREHWEEMLPRLVADHLVCPSDVATLGMACSFYSAYMTAVRDGNLNNAKKASDAYLRIMMKYGVTPEGRSRLDIGKHDQGPDDDDTTGDLFGDFFT